MHRVTQSVAVVIPAHEEASTIAAVVRSVRRYVPGAAVVVVDDGSIDDTSAVAAAAGATVLRLERNRGKGFAIRAGVNATGEDVLVFIDADGQDDPAEIPAMLAALTPGVEIVIGSRFLGVFGAGAITRLNLLGTYAINTCGWLLFGRYLTDACAGFRAVRRSAFQAAAVSADGYDIEVDVAYRVLRAGGRIVEVPAVRSARTAGASGLSSFRDGLRILGRMVAIRFARIPRTLSAPSER